MCKYVYAMCINCCQLSSFYCVVSILLHSYDSENLLLKIVAICVSSIGYFFGSPFRCAVQNGGPSASGRHLGWPHFPRSSKMATGSGRAAILHRAPQWGSKKVPQVLDDVISGVAILDSRWRLRKWRLEDVETPVKTSYRRLPHPWVL